MIGDKVYVVYYQGVPLAVFADLNDATAYATALAPMIYDILEFIVE